MTQQSSLASLEAAQNETIVLPDEELPEGFRVVVPTGKDHNEAPEAGGVQFQKCGGGRRIIRKKIS